MKILYGIQGTGHGHVSRAREIIPKLLRLADVDVLMSGYNCKLSIDGVQVDKKRGVSLTYDSNGGISFLKTVLQIQPVRFLQDVNSIEIDTYSAIISDYEPVTAWAARTGGLPSISLSHQASFLSDKSPRPEKKSLLAEKILKHFAPCNKPIGFHFQRYDRFILPPIIRHDVRQLDVKNGSHVTVYLPAFDHETLTSMFLQCKQAEWHLFSPLCDAPYQKDNVFVHPVGNKPFLESLAHAKGVITSAGFETCAEAMYLGKKLLVVPIKNQYEQLCNAAALQQMGVDVVKSIDGTFSTTIENWLRESSPVQLPEIADTDMLAKDIVRFAHLYNRKKNLLFG